MLFFVWAASLPPSVSKNNTSSYFIMYSRSARKRLISSANELSSFDLRRSALSSSCFVRIIISSSPFSLNYIRTRGFTFTTSFCAFSIAQKNKSVNAFSLSGRKTLVSGRKKELGKRAALLRTVLNSIDIVPTDRKRTKNW